MTRSNLAKSIDWLLNWVFILVSAGGLLVALALLESLATDRPRLVTAVMLVLTALCAGLGGWLGLMLGRARLRGDRISERRLFLPFAVVACIFATIVYPLGLLHFGKSIREVLATSIFLGACLIFSLLRVWRRYQRSADSTK